MTAQYVLPPTRITRNANTGHFRIEQEVTVSTPEGSVKGWMPVGLLTWPTVEEARTVQASLGEPGEVWAVIE